MKRLWRIQRPDTQPSFLLNVNNIETRTTTASAAHVLMRAHCQDCETAFKKHSTKDAASRCIREAHVWVLAIALHACSNCNINKIYIVLVMHSSVSRACHRQVRRCCTCTGRHQRASHRGTHWILRIRRRRRLWTSISYTPTRTYDLAKTRAAQQICAVAAAAAMRRSGSCS